MYMLKEEKTTNKICSYVVVILKYLLKEMYKMIIKKYTYYLIYICLYLHKYIYLLTLQKC